LRAIERLLAIKIGSPYTSYLEIIMRGLSRRTYESHLFALRYIHSRNAETYKFAAAPKERLKLSTDADWPSSEVWKAQLPGVIPRHAKATNEPDYRLQPKTAAEVQKAVKFAKNNNV
jgi:hypothetical protein